MRFTLIINDEMILNFVGNYVRFLKKRLIDKGRGKKELEKRLQKQQKDQQDAAKKGVKEAWLEIKNTNYPARPDEMEQFFLGQISQAEALATQGISFNRNG